MVISADISEADFDLLSAEIKNLPRRLDDILVDAAEELIEGEMRREIMTRLRKAPTGRMARSVRTQVEGRGTALVGPTVPYAGIQNFGGIITAKGKKLAVPLSFGLVPKGKWPKDWPAGQLTLIPRKGKDSILAVVGKRFKRGKKKGQFRIKAKYVLKDKVEIKGVHYIEATERQVAAEVEDFIARRIEDLLVEATIAAGGVVVE